jgi:hypothetical protein
VAQAVECLLCKCQALSSNPRRWAERKTAGGWGRKKEGRERRAKEAYNKLRKEIVVKPCETTYFNVKED